MSSTTTTAKARALFPNGLYQAEGSYRFGEEALLLARFVDECLPKQFCHVAELGTGCGAALFALTLSRENLCAVGFEKEAPHLSAAIQNCTMLGLEERVHFVSCDLTLNQRSCLYDGLFDAVFTNPPFFDLSEGRSSQSALRSKALRGHHSMAVFLLSASLLLRHHGFFFTIYPAAKTQSLLCALASARFGLRMLKPLFHTRPMASRILIAARKDAKEDCFLIGPYPDF